jgi:hypothetical protein
MSRVIKVSMITFMCSCNISSEAFMSLKNYSTSGVGGSSVSRSNYGCIASNISSILSAPTWPGKGGDRGPVGQGRRRSGPTGQCTSGGVQRREAAARPDVGRPRMVGPGAGDDADLRRKEEADTVGAERSEEADGLGTRRRPGRGWVLGGGGGVGGRGRWGRARAAMVARGGRGV